MKYQCIDCKAEFSGERKVCPQCRSRYIIFLEQEQKEHDDQPATRADEEHSAGEPEPQDETQFETRAKLKSGDILKVNETVAAIMMEAGECYRVASMKRDYYEEIYCLSTCDEQGTVAKDGTRELPARSLDYWLDTDSITILETAKSNHQL